MNRIYNVIWSKAKNCYVVVSELVKSGGGKASVNSARTSITFRAALCAFAITGCLVSGIAEANVIQGLALLLLVAIAWQSAIMQNPQVLSLWR